MYFVSLPLGETPNHRYAGVWKLPHGDVAGDWMPRMSYKDVLYNSDSRHTAGYVVYKDHQILGTYRFAPRLFEAEAKDYYDGHDVYGSVRLLRCLNWNAETARTFSCDCIDHVLDICGEYVNIDLRQQVKNVRSGITPRVSSIIMREYIDKAILAISYKDYWDVANEVVVQTGHAINALARIQNRAVGVIGSSEREWEYQRLLELVITQKGE